MFTKIESLYFPNKLKIFSTPFSNTVKVIMLILSHFKENLSQTYSGKHFGKSLSH